MKKIITTSIFLALYVASAPVVLASEELPVRKVGYADLDLTSDAGRNALHRRIGRAVHDLCGSPDARDLVAISISANCTKAAWASTRTQVALAMISAKRRLASVSGEGPQSVRVEMRR